MRRFAWCSALLVLIGCTPDSGGASSDATEVADTPTADGEPLDVSVDPDAQARQLTDTPTMAKDSQGGPFGDDVPTDRGEDAAELENDGNEVERNDGVETDRDAFEQVQGAATVVVFPPEGEWTASTGFNNSCVCDGTTPFCHAIYAGLVQDIVDHTVHIRFAKVDGSGPSINVDYQLRAPSVEKPTCLTKLAAPVVSSGQWSANQPLHVSYSPWNSDAAFLAAPCGDTHRLSIITTGADDPTTFRWWMGTPLVIRKVCAEGGEGAAPGRQGGGSTPTSVDLSTRSFLWGIGEPVTWNSLAAAKQWDFDGQLDVAESLAPELLMIWMSHHHLFTAQGVLNPERVPFYKEAVAKVQERGWPLIVMDHGLAAWVTGVSEGVLPCYDPSPGSDYQQFLDRYEQGWFDEASLFPEVDTWVAGNEPNEEAFLHPAVPCPDGALFNGKPGFSWEQKARITLDMLFRSRRAIRNANPEAFVYMSGLSMRNAEWFLLRLYELMAEPGSPSSDPRDYFDGHNWHPYVGSNLDAQSWVQLLQKLWTIVQVHGDGDVPVFLGELGLSDQGVDAVQHQQANWMLQSVQAAIAELPWLTSVAWFRLFDDPTQSWYEGGFGMCGPPPLGADWKPAAFTFRLIADAEPKAAGTVARWDFESDDSLGAVFWSGAEQVERIGGWLVGRSSSPQVELEFALTEPAPLPAGAIEMSAALIGPVELRLHSDSGAIVHAAEIPFVGDGEPESLHVSIPTTALPIARITLVFDSIPGSTWRVARLSAVGSDL